jgi:hypothetical protein
MAVNLSPVGGVAGQFFDNNGDPLVGGKLFTFAAGTTTPQITYTSASGTTPNSNPIILNGGGRVPAEIWLTDGLQYKFVLYSSTNQLIGSWDNVVGINSNFVNFTSQQEIQTATAGQTVFTLTTMQYLPGTNSLTVFVDGVNQYGPGAQYAYIETDGTTVTFVTGLHVGASVKFTTSIVNSTAATTADQVSYTPAGSGAVVTNVQAKLRETVSVKDFGAVGDSNGTTGNGTDDTVAIQAAVDFANATGRIVFIPAGCYRITAPINFTGVQSKSGFVGESNFNTIIFADFTSVTAVAALTLDNSTPRAYVAFKNFRLEGLNNANVSGIYTNLASEFTEFENVWVYKFYNGFVISTDFNVKVTRCQAWYNSNNGFQIGYQLDGVTTGAANNVMLLGCLSTYNNANGFFVYACRALGMVQCDGEANDFSNIYLDSVYGASLSGIYMEYSSTEPANPTGQLILRNCTGVSVNGLSVSAFDDNSNPVIFLDQGNNGVDLVGLAIETAGSPTNAIGVKVFDSFGVSIRNSYFNGMANGVRLENNCRVNISGSNFSNCTIPVLTDGLGSKQLVWQDAVTSEVAASASQIGSEVSVDLTTINNQKNQVNLTKAFNVTVNHSDIVSAALKTIIDSVFLTEQWRIVNIIAVTVTPFSGGGGDRGLVITDGTHNYTVIPAASLQATTVQAQWGSTAVPYSAVVSDMVQPTTAASNLSAAYAGGTTDYSAGAVNITVVAERIA